MRAAPLVLMLLLMPSASALGTYTLNVPDEEVYDFSTAFQNPSNAVYTWTFRAPPFSFASNDSNVSAFVVVGKTDYGEIAASTAPRRVTVNYTITGVNATGGAETHHIVFDAYIFRNWNGFWWSEHRVTIDGVYVYELTDMRDSFGWGSVSYATSHVVGLTKNSTLKSFGFNRTHADVFGPENHRTTNAAFAFNYSSAVYIAEPFLDTRVLNNAANVQSFGGNDAGLFAFNLSYVTAFSAVVVYQGEAPKSEGFVYAFLLGDDDVGRAFSTGTACEGLFSGLIFTFFGFCPTVDGLATYAANRVGSLIAFPLTLAAKMTGSAAIASASSTVSIFVKEIVGLYTFTFALVILHPLNFTILWFGLAAAFSPLVAVLVGDVRVAPKGLWLAAKAYFLVLAFYFVVLFYVLKALVWLVVHLVKLIVDGISAARSFFKLV